MDSLTVKRLRVKAIAKLTFLGYVCAFVPIFTVVGILAALDLLDFRFNGQPIEGLTAALVGPAAGLWIAVMLGLLSTATLSLGLWLWSRSRPISLEFYPANEE